MTEPFPNLFFKGQLRPSQESIVQIAREQLASGERKLHVVAPPGTGKTVLGLYLWAECIKEPALVLSPNSAIQMQWAARTDLFHGGDHHQDVKDFVSTDSARPSYLTSLTYQAVTMPKRGGEGLDQAAKSLWVERLLEKGQALNEAESLTWIEDLSEKNPEYFKERFSAFRKEVRDLAGMKGEALEMLHASSRATLQRIKERGIGLIILDECHHLVGHWGRVLANAFEFLDRPVVLGLTATPPEESGKDRSDMERYKRFFGPIDYEVPVPAIVKDGFLAPYQDLAYFVRPTSQELHYIANVDRKLRELFERLCSSELSESLPAWVSRSLRDRSLGIHTAKDWQDFIRRDERFADAACVFLARDNPLSMNDIPPLPPDSAAFELSELEIVGTLMDRYVRHYLRRSEDSRDRKLADEAIADLRLLGIQITETGSQPCASPVSRVMAYSLSKCEALREILSAEHAFLREDIRAVVVADFEKSSAVSSEISHLMDEEAGGAVAAFKALLKSESTDVLDPILVTGSSILLDDDVAPKIIEAAEVWLRQSGEEVELKTTQYDGFWLLKGSGGGWSPRVYVQLITELFQKGLTKCLVGTRGLLGEGWDANRINVLIDLTSVTTSMTVNQLRGRSIRLDPLQPQKVANNWDVVCVAAEFNKGLDDYLRFCKKHQTIFGVTDDGAIEKGVGHVHASFTDIQPEGIEESLATINTEMLSRVALRDLSREQWKIGHPYHPEPVRTLELKGAAGEGGFPALPGAVEPWSSGSLTMAIGEAVLGALRDAGLIVAQKQVRMTQRDGGYLRIFLANSAEEDAAMFSRSLKEAIGPLNHPRYVIPRSVDYQEDTLLSRFLPEVVGKYFRKLRREMVMLHAVPSELAKHKDLVQIFQKHWNHWVSPGEALYAHRGPGVELIEQCTRSQQIPKNRVREKHVFLNHESPA